MAEFTGKDLVCNWVHPAGTVTLSGDQRTVSFSPSIDFADTTAGSDANRTRIATIKDASISYSGLAQSGGTATEDALAPGTFGTLIIQPEGTASGKRKYTIPAFSQGAKMNYPYSDVVELSVDFVGHGAYTAGTN